MNVYITGDPHARFDHIEQYCRQMGISRDDLMIILGDSCLNYFNDERDNATKEAALKAPVSYLILQGNHDLRPEHVVSCELINWHGGKVWKDSRYPGLMFARDGDVFDIGGKKVLIIGGACSVDKYDRLSRGYRWFEDEQPDDEIKVRTEQSLDTLDWKVDTVLTHTCPKRFIPKDKLLKSYDKIDNSTEEWLDTIESRLDYQKWFCGHYHINLRVGKLTFLYHEVLFFGSEN